MNTPGRVRVTISISKDLSDRLDDYVDGVKIRNRSHAIETLITDGLDMSSVKVAVIMAGGENALKRLPAIEKMLKSLRNQGIFDIIVATGYLGDKIRKQLESRDADGLRLQFIESELGTGGALLSLKPKLKNTFLVVNIDQPINVDLRNLLRFHREHTPLVTVASKSLRELSGIYIVEPKIFSHIPEGFCMLEDSVFHDVAQIGKLLFYPLA